MNDWPFDRHLISVRRRGLEAKLAFGFAGSGGAAGAGRAGACLDRSPHLEGLEIAKERVRIAVAQGDLDVARRTLARWPTQPDPRARQIRTLWLAVVESLDGDAPAEIQALSRVVIELEQEGQIGLFLDVGRPMLGPLRPLYRAAPSPFLRRVLHHPRLAGGPDVPPAKVLAETLTAQEMTVLGYLPSWISGAGIAERLGISLNTIKTHMKHIYRKLDVADRREAVDVARQLGLL